MNTMQRLAIFHLAPCLALAVALAMGAKPAFACAPVWREGDNVRIDREEAIIIWDARRKTQHFIRRASFAGAKSKDFGFLVPTPNAPILGEAYDDAFGHAHQVTAPRVIEVPTSNHSLVPSMAAGLAAPGRVQVLATKRVAGYDAAVLDAKDAQALDRWLKGNGYQSNPELMDWYQPYLDKRWKITAFKIAAEPEHRIATSAVRMSFRTDRPFFPYREPKRADENKTSERLLRVYLIADGRYAARVGADSKLGLQPVWSGRLNAEQRHILGRLVRIEDSAAKEAVWLTEFQDRASVRPGSDDLFFSRAEDQAPIERTPIRQYVYRP